MAKRGRIGVGLLQWLIVPMALGAVGYFVVGPRLSGTSVAQRARALELKLPAIGGNDETVETAPQAGAKEPPIDRLQVDSKPEDKPGYRAPKLQVTTEPKKERSKLKTSEANPDAKPKPQRKPVQDTLPDLEGGEVAPLTENPIGPMPPKRSGGTTTDPQGDTLSSIESAIIQPTTAPI